MTRSDLTTIDKAARAIGEIQGRLRLLSESLPAELRPPIEAAADALDGADEQLTKLYCEQASQPPEPPPPPDTLTVPQAAREASVSADKVRIWCRSGIIPGAWNSGDREREFWRIPRPAWAEFLASRAADPQEPIREVQRKLRKLREPAPYVGRYMVDRRDDGPRAA